MYNTELSPSSFTLTENVDLVKVEAAEEIPLDIDEDAPSDTSFRQSTSDDVFGAYVAARLMDFPPDIRKKKKIKILNLLGDIFNETQYES